MRIECVFPALVCFILIGCNCASARFTVLTQKSPVVAAVGDIALLPCRASNLNLLTDVRWIRTQAGRRYIINNIHDGRDQQKCELPEYIGRMEVMKGELARGGVALKLFNVSVADEGVYRCYLETLYYFDFGDLELRVTALGSDPRIDIEGFQDGGRKAVCRSAGWYPEPALVNKDNNGEMKIQKEENGLYSIEYSRVIKENSNRTFSCMLRSSFPNQEKETSVYLTDDLFRKRTDNSIIIALSTVTTIVLILAALMAIYILKIRLQREKEVEKKDEEAPQGFIAARTGPDHDEQADQLPVEVPVSADRDLLDAYNPLTGAASQHLADAGNVTDAYSAVITKHHSLEEDLSVCLLES